MGIRRQEQDIVVVRRLPSLVGSTPVASLEDLQKLADRRKTTVFVFRQHLEFWAEEKTNVGVIAQLKGETREFDVSVLDVYFIESPKLYHYAQTKFARSRIDKCDRCGRNMDSDNVIAQRYGETWACVMHKHCLRLAEQALATAFDTGADAAKLASVARSS
jgi:hypothetical protein